MLKCAVVAGVVSVVLLAATSADAVPLFSHNFDADPPGLNATPLNFTISNGGSTDVLSHGDFGLPCAGGAGRCVDLDGSTGLGAVLNSDPISLGLGSYTLSYDLAGSQRGDANTVTISLAGPVNIPVASISLPSTALYQTFTNVIAISTAGNYSIVFDLSTSHDFLGLLLDNVVLDAALPEPASLLIFGLGLLGLGSLRWRRRAVGIREMDVVWSR